MRWRTRSSPPRDPRTYRRLHREFDAAKKVLGAGIEAKQDSWLIKKWEEHEELLTLGLRAMKLQMPGQDPATCFQGKVGKSGKSDPEHMVPKFALPDTLEFRCLHSNLGQEHTLFVDYGKCKDALIKYYALCGWVYSELLDLTQRRGHDFAILTESVEEGPSVAILPGFADTLYLEIHRLLSVGMKDPEDQDLRYQVDPIYSSLKFRGALIVNGLIHKFDRIEAEFQKLKALHSEIRRELPRYVWVKRLTDPKDYCQATVVQNNYAIEVMSRQGEFLKGSCVIFQSWGRI
jgi:hypothetical protein